MVSLKLSFILSTTKLDADFNPLLLHPILFTYLSNHSQKLVFSKTPLAPADAIFALTAAYVADQTKEKVNLGVGAYRDNDGKPYVLPVVRKVRLFSPTVDFDS